MSITSNNDEIDTRMPIIQGADLKQMRLHAKLTTSLIAAYMGIKSTKTIESWEVGRSAPSIHQFIILCRFYEMDASKIVAQCIARARGKNTKDKHQPINVKICQMGSE